MASYAAFDPSAHLDNDEVIGEFLLAAAGDADSETFVAALGDVVETLRDTPGALASFTPTLRNP